MDLFLVAQVSLSFCFLLYAAFKDYRVREVSNRVWLVYALFALPLAAVSLAGTSWFSVAIYVASVSAVSAISVATFYLNGWGGADAKAAVCLSFSIGFATVNVLFLSLIAYLTYSLRYKFSKVKNGYNAPFLVFLFGAFVAVVLMGLR